MVDCQPKEIISIDSKNVTIIAKLNEQTTFTQVQYVFPERAEKWLFGDSSSGSTSVIYADGELKDKQRFQCKSVTGRCDSLTIMNTTKKELGQYARSGSSIDNAKFTFTSYFLSGYEAPINLKCYSSLSQCRFNKSTNVLTVRENDQVIISCEVNFWKSDTAYGIPAEVFYRSTNSEECNSNENRFVNVTTDTLGSNRIQNIQLKKDCSRSFTNSETGSTYVCGMRYINTGDSFRNNEIDRLNIKLDVQYGPLSLVSSAIAANEFNKTGKQGTPVTLKCPYEGNPISYFWKQVSGPGLDTTEFAGNKELTLAKSLAIGQYQYQCRSYVGGFIDSKTDPILFSVNIQDNRSSTKKGKKTILNCFFFIALIASKTKIECTKFY